MQEKNQPPKPPLKTCAGPGCSTKVHFPYARETGGLEFCKFDCWNAWRKIQPPRFPANAT